ncbi:MAG: hypothetical protein K2H64_07125 [Desulfovibrio sp.]|nr:hypothetical protein [Desulfovibrio sp.]
MEDQQDRERGEYFFGEPFEALGNAWAAIYGDSDEEILSNIATYLPETYPEKDREAPRNMDPGFSYLVYPERSPARICFLIETEGDRNLMAAMYPLLEGWRENLETLNFKAWENGLEGMVAARSGTGKILNFFDPFYAYDSLSFTKGAKSEFRLAALAFRCEKSSVNELKITKGPLYEMSLKEFLEKNPDKTAAAFPGAAVVIQGARMLLPTPYTGEYEFRSIIEEMDEIEFLSKKLYRYKIGLGDRDDAEPCVYLYAPENAIKGDAPRIGDDIDGVLWLCGYKTNAPEKY